jgi:hypothetical protein
MEPKQDKPNGQPIQLDKQIDKKLDKKRRQLNQLKTKKKTMTPMEISFLVATSFTVLTIGGAIVYQIYQDIQNMRLWQADYQLRMTELDQTLKSRVPLDKVLKLYNDSGEVVKQSCAEGDMSTQEDRDNVVFLNAVNEEQR